MRSFSARSMIRGALVVAGFSAVAALGACAASGHSVSVAAKPEAVRSAQARLSPDGKVSGRVCRSVEVASPRDYQVAIVLKDAAGHVVAQSQANAQGFADRPHRPNCAGFAASFGAPAAQAASVELTIRDPRES